MSDTLIIGKAKHPGRLLNSHFVQVAWRSGPTVAPAVPAFAPTFNVSMVPEDHILISRSHDASRWGRWNRSLDEMRLLKDGWNGYSAPAPSPVQEGFPRLLG
jgi:hypothetical protein